MLVLIILFYLFFLIRNRTSLMFNKLIITEELAYFMYDSQH